MGICNCNFPGINKPNLTNDVYINFSETKENKSELSNNKVQISVPTTPKKETNQFKRKTTKKLIKVTGLNRKDSIAGYLAQITKSANGKSILSFSLVEPLQSFKIKESKPRKRSRQNRLKTFNGYSRQYSSYMAGVKSKKKQENNELSTTNTNSHIKEGSIIKPAINNCAITTLIKDDKMNIDLNSTIIRSKSLLKENSSFCLSPKNQTNGDNENDEKEEDSNIIKPIYKVDLSTLELTSDEEILIKTSLINNTMFDNLLGEHISLIGDCLNLYEFENDVCIFKEGEDSNYFFLIISGQIKLKTRNDSKILSKGDCFGESSLLNVNTKKRAYSAYTLSKVQIFSFNVDDFKNILINKGDNYTDFFHQTKLQANKEKYKNNFFNFYLFQYLPVDIKEDLFSFIKLITIKDDNTLLISSFNSLSKQTSTFNHSQKPFLNHSRYIIFPVGENSSVIEKYKQHDQIKTINKGNAAGLIYTFFKSNINFEYEVYSNSNECVCLILSDEMLRECIGIDYAKEILFYYFMNMFKISSDLIPYLVSKNFSSKENEILMYRILYKDFYIEEYKINDKVISNSFHGNKYILTLNEDLFHHCHSKTAIPKGSLIGDEMINHHKL